jgi:hypothetical protein
MPRVGLSVCAEFLRGFGIKDFIDKQTPLPKSNRGHRAWNVGFNKILNN